MLLGFNQTSHVHLYLSQFVLHCHYFLTRWWSFNIGGIGSIHWSLMKMREVEIFVMGARNQYLVLATVVTDAEITSIINHVLNYPLGCTIPHTQIILLFSFVDINILTTKKNMTNLANATSAEKRVMNTVIVVIVATSTFTSDVFFSTHHPNWSPWPPIDPLHLEADEARMRLLWQRR